MAIMPKKVKREVPAGKVEEEVEALPKSRKVGMPKLLGRPALTVNEPEPSLTNTVLLLYGEKGVGKTSLASQWPGAAVFSWEPRRWNLPVKMIPARGCAFCKAKPKSRGTAGCAACGGSGQELPLDADRADLWLDVCLADPKIETVVMDTVDRWYDAILTQVCQEKGCTHPSEVNDYGKTWDEVKRRFESRIGSIIAADRTLILVSHSRVREEEVTYGGSQMRLAPTASPAAWKILKACCEVAIHYGWENHKRVITVRGGEEVWSACGWETAFLIGKEQIARFEVPNKKEEVYGVLEAAFENRLKKGVVTVKELESVE